MPRCLPLACLLLLAAAPVTTFHNDNRRSGAYVEPTLDTAHAARLHLDAAFHGNVHGNVLAQPLFWLSASHPAGLVVAATEENHVTALDAATGTKVWDRTLGPPVPDRELPCGNIVPLGITGTPVIDEAAGTLYAVAQIETNSGPTAQLFAIALDTGETRPSYPLDIGKSLGPSFDVRRQGQRGALLLLEHTLIVPFGGRSGDCTPFHGWLAPLDTQTGAFRPAFSTQAIGGGIWAFGGPAAADGAVFAATGNTFGAKTWAYGEAVLRFDPASMTAPVSSFAPANWPALDADDLDLGGSTPEPLEIQDRHFLLALGKDGKAYLLDRSHLGGIGGALLAALVSIDEIRTSPANWMEGNAALVAFGRRGAACPPDRQGVTALRVTPAAITTAWCARLDGAGSPIVTTTNGTANRILWIIGADGDDRLHGFDAGTGREIFTGGGAAERMHGLHYTATILAAANHLYVGAVDRIYAFTW